MKNLASIPRLIMVAIAGSSLCLLGNTYAQSTSDNPHLRAKDSPQKAAATTKAMSDKDSKFILKAAAGGQTEIENGMMAEKKAKEAATKVVAKRVVEDHTRANKDLVALAKKKGLAVSTENIQAQHLPDANFDAQYLHDLKTYHQEDIAAFQKEAREGDDADIKGWAARELPMLKAHLALVEETISKMK
jgi:putative membrane protein